MIDLGVKKQISCYSMVPWRLSFQYFDQASNSFKFLEAKPGEAAYEEFWINMLQDFAKHLKAKRLVRYHSHCDGRKTDEGHAGNTESNP